MALGLGLAACQRGMSVGFTTAASSLVHELMEARDERRLLNLQTQLSRLNLLIIDELGFVPLSQIHRSTFLPFQEASRTPSFGGLELRKNRSHNPSDTCAYAESDLTCEHPNDRRPPTE